MCCQVTIDFSSHGSALINSLFGRHVSFFFYKQDALLWSVPLSVPPLRMKLSWSQWNINPTGVSSLQEEELVKSTLFATLAHVFISWKISSTLKSAPSLPPH